MFEKDQLIMCGGHGVCRVVNVTGNPFDKFDKVRKFYVLEPVFEKASTVYKIGRASCRERVLPPV